jgi:hypothetical protein
MPARRARTGDLSGDRFGRVDREVLDDGSARAVADDHAIAGAGENLLCDGHEALIAPSRRVVDRPI